MTAQDTADRIAGALQDGVPRPTPLIDAYLDLMANGDENCPGDLYQITDDFILGCEASTGYQYSGVSDYINASKEGADYQLLAGDFIIATPSGEEFRLGGGAELYTMPDGSSQSLVGGSVTWEGGEEGWMSGGSSMWMIATTQNDRFSLQGAVGMNNADLYFDEVYFDPSVCDGPIGSIRVRGDDDHWYTLTRQSDCDPCGTVTFHDTDIGTGCADLSAWAAATLLGLMPS